MTTWGVDYSTRMVNLAALAGAGKTFAGRYGGPGSAGKHLTAGEANGLADHGIAVFSLVEGETNGALKGRIQGRDDAASAMAGFHAVGMPMPRPYYFAVDFAPTLEQWPYVRDYFYGVNDVLSKGQIGIYAGFDAIGWARRDNLAEWFFQTYAWSRGLWHDWLNIRQYKNGRVIGGMEVDLCQADTQDFGQWFPVGHQPKGATMALMDDPDFKRLAYRIEAQIFDRPALVEGSGEINQQHTVLHAILDTLAGVDTAVKAEAGAFQAVVALAGKVDALAAKVQALIDTPMVDAVAVATAIGARPEIAATVAEQVRAHLGTISLSGSLSGALSGGVVPPVG